MRTEIYVRETPFSFSVVGIITYSLIILISLFNNSSKKNI